MFFCDFLFFIILSVTKIFIHFAEEKNFDVVFCRNIFKISETGISGIFFTALYHNLVICKLKLN